MRTKVFSFPNGKLINDQALFDTLSDSRKKEIKGIIKKFDSKAVRKKISKSIAKEITSREPETLLLMTFTIGHSVVSAFMA